MLPDVMKPVNLLAFIQIAVAFDFGLLCLGNTHIFANFFGSLLSQMEYQCRATLEDSNAIIDKLKYNTSYQVRVNRSALKDELNHLKYLLAYENAEWAKYTYIGLYSGIYGLVCLFCLGLCGCEEMEKIESFLLFFGMFILSSLIINLFRLKKLESQRVSVVKVFKKMEWLLFFLIISLISSLLGLNLSGWISFNIPFIILCTLIVYAPFLVYAFRVIHYAVKINNSEKECRNLQRELLE